MSFCIHHGTYHCTMRPCVDAANSGRDALDELAELIESAGAVLYFHARDCAMWDKPLGACDKECGRKAYEAAERRKTSGAAAPGQEPEILTKPGAPVGGVQEPTGRTAARPSQAAAPCPSSAGVTESLSGLPGRPEEGARMPCRDTSTAKDTKGREK